MSFFGFDTTLPTDKGGGRKGIFENTDPFAQVADVADDDA